MLLSKKKELYLKKNNITANAQKKQNEKLVSLFIDHSVNQTLLSSYYELLEANEHYSYYHKSSPFVDMKLKKKYKTDNFTYTVYHCNINSSILHNSANKEPTSEKKKNILLPNMEGSCVSSLIQFDAKSRDFLFENAFRPN